MEFIGCDVLNRQRVLPRSDILRDLGRSRSTSEVSGRLEAILFRQPGTEQEAVSHSIDLRKEVAHSAGNVQGLSAQIGEPDAFCEDVVLESLAADSVA